MKEYTFDGGPVNLQLDTRYIVHMDHRNRRFWIEEAPTPTPPPAIPTQED